MQDRECGGKRAAGNERGRAEVTGGEGGFGKESGMTFLQSQGHEKRPHVESENC